MSARLLFASALAALSALLLVSPCGAAPVDARVGEHRATYDKKGTTLRAEPSKTAAPTGTLGVGSLVIVEEVKLPWLRVREARGAATGWVMAWKTVEHEAMQPNRAPPPIKGRVRGVSQGDATAAGRQFDADTEARFRSTRADLREAYAAVDRLEMDTRNMQPADDLAFIMEGSIGRRGRNYDRVPLTGPSAKPSGRDGRGKRRAGRALGGAGRVLGGLLGKGKGGGAVRDAGRAMEGALEFTSRIQQLNQRFTPEQEYYLGRAVAAEAIAKYGVEKDVWLRLYVRQIGEAIVRTTNKLPRTFAGYHFEVLDTDKVNGVSGPGGFVLITRGAVQACTTEDEVAAVLCHELAHSWRKHGEAVLRKSKQWGGQVNAVLSGLKAGGVSGEQFGQQWLGLFTTGAGVMSNTAVNEGYGQQLEFQADADGARLLWDTYYAPTAMRDVLARLSGGSHGHARTHAAPEVRANALAPTLATLTQFLPTDQILAERKARYESKVKKPVGVPMR